MSTKNAKDRRFIKLTFSDSNNTAITAILSVIICDITCVF